MPKQEEYTEQEIKEAQEQIAAAKQRGFIEHLVASEKSASDIRSMHARYVKDDAKRLEYLEGLRTAIIGDSA